MKKEFLDKIDQYPIPSFKEICRDIYQNSTPFPHIRLENLFSTDLMENIVENVYNIKDEYKWNKLCTVGNDFSQFGKSAEVLTNHLVSDEWVNFISELTGIDNLYADKNWYSSGINVEPRGSHLEPHTDLISEKELVGEGLISYCFCLKIGKRNGVDKMSLDIKIKMMNMYVIKNIILTLIRLLFFQHQIFRIMVLV